MFRHYSRRLTLLGTHRYKFQTEFHFWKNESLYFTNGYDKVFWNDRDLLFYQVKNVWASTMGSFDKCIYMSVGIYAWYILIYRYIVHLYNEITMACMLGKNIVRMVSCDFQWVSFFLHSEETMINDPTHLTSDPSHFNIRFERGTSIYLFIYFSPYSITFFFYFFPFIIYHSFYFRFFLYFPLLYSAK